MNEEDKIKKIIEILEKHSDEIDNFNHGVFNNKFKDVAKEIINLDKPKCIKCGTFKIVESNIPKKDYYCPDCSIHFNI